MANQTFSLPNLFKGFFRKPVELVEKFKDLFSYADKPIPTPTPGPDPFAKLKAQGWREVSPTQAPSPTPTAVPQLFSKPEQFEDEELKEIERKMRKGFREYGKGNPLLAEQYVPKFLDAIKRYPIFKKFPFLLPEVSILETSAGQNITRPKNLLNWAARLQAKGLYNPESFEQAIEDATTAIGGDISVRQVGTPRYTTMQYYEPFRKSEDIADFVKAYENKPEYLSALRKGMEAFANQ